MLEEGNRRLEEQTELIMESSIPLYRFCFVFFLSQFWCIYGQYITTNFGNGMHDCKVTGYSLLKTTAQSLSSCCTHCTKHNKCLSVSYKKHDGTCILHDVCPPKCSSIGLEETGWSLLCLGDSTYCLSIQCSKPNAPDGVYTIFPVGENGIKVFCDMTTEGGGWIVFQRRMDGSVDFFRGWNAYKNGFGDRGGEYWLGNDNLHKLTKQGSCLLRIDMVSELNEFGYAEYWNFTIGSEQEGYVLDYSQFQGSVEDGLTFHKGQKFSTKDRDNDLSASRSCAERSKGAWWYKNCYSANLNGLYEKTNERYNNIMWDRWKPWNSFYQKRSLKNTKMMIKC